MTDKKPCTQTKCGFHSSKGDTSIHCPVCADCGCESHVIDEDCVNCWNCLRDEGYIRNGKPQAMAQAQKVQPDVIEVIQ